MKCIFFYTADAEEAGEDQERFREGLRKAGACMDELIHSLDFRYSPANDLLRLYIYVIRGDGRSRQPQFGGAFENLSENYNRAFVSIPGSEPTGYFTADYGKYADSICWLNLRKRELTESLSHGESGIPCINFPTWEFRQPRSSWQLPATRYL